MPEATEEQQPINVVPPQASTAPATPPAEPADTDWKAEARKWEQRAKEHKAALDDAAPKLAQWQALEEASKTELEQANDKIAAAESRAKALVERAAKAEIKAQATGFNDPNDAAAFLDAVKYVRDDGEIDTEAIKADVAKILAERPYLARQPQALPPNPAQGTTGNSPTTAGQLTKDDVDRLYAEHRYGDIEQARLDGRLASLLGQTA